MEALAESIINNYDSNHDGALNEQEFLAYLTKEVGITKGEKKYAHLLFEAISNDSDEITSEELVDYFQSVLDSNYG